jgi:hypothetical protein
MECLEFRRVAGADPAHLGAEAERHRSSCERCAAHHRQLQAMDTTIRQALEVPVRGYSDSMRRTQARTQRRPARPRWLALAASVAGGVIVGSVLWVAQPRTSLARDLVEHVLHERSALVATQQRVDEATVKHVLEASGLRLRANPGVVSYAMSCPFRGATVPHLVVQTDSGPVAVLVLRGEQTRQPMQFDEQGYAGTITAFGPGSIAVIGAAQGDLGQVETLLRQSIEWVG